jgi:hypothetical protein
MKALRDFDKVLLKVEKELEKHASVSPLWLLGVPFLGPKKAMLAAALQTAYSRHATPTSYREYPLLSMLHSRSGFFSPDELTAFTRHGIKPK